MRFRTSFSAWFYDWLVLWSSEYAHLHYVILPVLFVRTRTHGSGITVNIRCHDREYTDAARATIPLRLQCTVRSVSHRPRCDGYRASDVRRNAMTCAGSTGLGPRPTTRVVSPSCDTVAFSQRPVDLGAGSGHRERHTLKDVRSLGSSGCVSATVTAGAAVAASETRSDAVPADNRYGCSSRLKRCAAGVV